MFESPSCPIFEFMWQFLAQVTGNEPTTLEMCNCKVGGWRDPRALGGNTMTDFGRTTANVAAWNLSGFYPIPADRLARGLQHVF